MSEPIQQKISEQIAQDHVVLYMKGTPDFPQCGFSATVVDILGRVGAKFKTYNVLEDQNLREGIKSFSSWPTIPQLYIGGKFVGGCDIAKELYGKGELEKLVQK